MSADLWDQILARVEGKVNRHSFATWFRPTSYVSLENDCLRIAVPNGQFREWLSKNYQGILGEALTEVGHPEMQVEFEEIADSASPPPSASAVSTFSQPRMRYRSSGKFPSRVTSPFPAPHVSVTRLP